MAHARLLSAFAAATQSGDLQALMQMLADDVRVVTDGGGKVPAALNVIEGADRAARFLVEVTRKRPGQWWRDDFTMRFATINGLPGVVVDSPDGPVQTATFEIAGDVIRALYVVRNSDKLRHLARPPRPHDNDQAEGGTVMIRSMVLFAHVVGMLVLFIGIAVEWLSLESLGRATTSEHAASWVRVQDMLRRVYGIAFVTLLVSGIYLARAIGYFEFGWLRLALGLMILMGVIGDLARERSDHAASG